MATVTVNTPVTGSTTSANTTHSVTLPGSISSGDALILIFENYDDSITASLTGWVQDITATISISGTDVRVTAFRKYASGGETTASVTTSGSTTANWVVQHYSDAVFNEYTSVSTGSDAAPDPPAFGSPTVSGDTASTLAVTGYLGDRSVSGYPVGFTSGQAAQRIAGGSGHGVATANKLSVDNEDAGAFTLSGSADWLAFSYWMTYQAGGGTPTDLTFSLDAGSLILTGYDFTPSALIFNLPAGSLTATGNAGTFNLLALLDPGTLSLSTLDSLTIVYDPTYPDAGSLGLTGYDLDFVIAQNVNPDLGTLSLTGNDFTGDIDVALDAGSLTLTAKTNLGCYQLAKNEIKPIDISGALFDLCVLPPDDLEQGDYFGCVLVGEHVSRSITFGFTAYPTPTALSTKGDQGIFRYIASEYYTWNQ